MANIPIVDFSAYSHKIKHGDRTKTAKEIDEAFRNVGFVYLKNHGVSKERVQKCFEWSRKFFALPLDTKMRAPHPPGGSHHRGYSAPGLEKVSQHTYDANELNKLREVPDHKESFECGNTTDAAQPNIWLPEAALPGFRDFMESFFADCSALIHQLLDALSVALSLDNSLSPTHSRSHFQLRLLHYPSLPFPELAQGKRSRINAHSDFGTLTLLFQDSVGGLEVEDPQTGGFRSVEPVDDAVLVNVGDLLARWSNGWWKSTVHRVMSPPALKSETEEEGGVEAVVGGMVADRYSIPFFATADPETVIEALPGCWSNENPKKYESVTAWGYVQMRMAALYSSSQS
ncbi:Clavaminate synthase-like protein [Macroventuria anomochaeta]|uniref:Clavaminate synthase-like protein n=1 Tax=Macroventuria anomochaeta TaxID=301207 RepID=A0ACB6RN97_9PLEO|nr:Clavaminate synthase-like protein [Macroventuria anomochaeta]KAF2623420.1 Clavaminate synthase-like protein [Macroventuria anomochaeta]